MTALHEAIRNKQVAVAARLIEAGADPTMPCDGQKTPLQLAQETGDARLVSLLERSLRELFRSGDKASQTVDVIGKCGPPAVGEPKIRDLRRAGPVIQVTYGKHCAAEITAADLSVRCTGCD